MMGVSPLRPGLLGRGTGDMREIQLQGRGSPSDVLSWCHFLSEDLPAPPSLSIAAHILLGWAPEAAPSRPAGRGSCVPPSPPPPERRATGPRFLWFTLLFIELETEAKAGMCSLGSEWPWTGGCLVPATSPSSPAPAILPNTFWWKFVFFISQHPHPWRHILSAAVSKMPSAWDLRFHFFLWLVNKHISVSGQQGPYPIQCVAFEATS